MKLSVALTLTALAFVLIGGQQAMAGNESGAQEVGASTKSRKSGSKGRPAPVPNSLNKNWQGAMAPGNTYSPAHAAANPHSNYGDSNGYVGKPPSIAQPSFQPTGNSYHGSNSASVGEISEDDMTYQSMEPTPRPPSQSQIQQEQSTQDFINAVSRPPQYEPSSIQSFEAEWSRNAKSLTKGNKPAGNSRVFAPDKTNKPIDSSANNLNKDTTTEKTEKPVGEANESQPK